MKLETNKFGMFIHWGIYAAVGLHEQSLARYDIPFETYDKLMQTFNPTEYDPEEWVLLAKKAGMKYICFTAKHHDGFCMWNTKYTDYSIMNTPYKKDVLKMLAEACEKHGMLLSIYYSNPDWHHENGYNRFSTHQWKSRQPNNGDMVKYRSYIKNQLGELLTNYGKIYTLFWDISPNVIDEEMNEYVRSLQPNILINDRGWDKGDFSTPERSVPDGSRFERMTEACQSVGQQSWGYRADEDYYSIRFLTSSIDKIMAMGGSYLLNVGPMANGKIPEKAKKVIEKVGDWYTRMQGALENHKPEVSAFELANNIPFVSTQKDGKTYIHLYEGAISSAIHFIKGMECPPKSARLLNDGRNLRVRFDVLPGLPGFELFNGRAEGPYTSIADIPCDEFANEPLVIEINWE